MYKQNKYMGLKLELLELEKMRSLHESDENCASLNDDLRLNTKANQPLRTLYCTNLQRKLTRTGTKKKKKGLAHDNCVWSSFHANTRQDKIYVLPAWIISPTDTSIHPSVQFSD